MEESRRKKGEKENNQLTYLFFALSIVADTFSIKNPDMERWLLFALPLRSRWASPFSQTGAASQWWRHWCSRNKFVADIFSFLFLIFALYKVIAESSAAHSYFFSFLFFSFLFFSSSCLAACTLVDWHFLSWVCFFHAKMVESIGLSRPRPQQWRPSKKMQIKSDRHKRGFVQ